MNYTLKDYQGQEIKLSPEQASKIANVAELIEIEVNGQTHYINPKNIASIKPVVGRETNDLKQLDVPDFRGKASPAKEKLRMKYGSTLPASK